MALAA